MIREKSHRLNRIWMAALLLYLLLPLAATGLYAVAETWTDTLLPEQWTLEWFRQMFGDPRLWSSLWTSVYLCVISVALSLAIMLPAVFVITVYFPKAEMLMKSLVVLPYAVPGVVAAVGLIRAYSSGPLNISGTVYLLLGAYFIVILPFMYQGIRNSLITVNAPELLHAAELLGAGPFRAFLTVIFPNIWPGVLISTLLSFSVLFGEFVLTNLLVGSHIITIQVYLYRRMGENGHIASAIAISYFIFILLLSIGLMRLGKRVQGGARS